MVCAGFPLSLSMAAFAPTPADLATFTDVDAIVGWLEFEPSVVDGLAAAVGARSRTLRTWARIPAARWTEVIATMKVTTDMGVERGLTPIEEGQVGDLQSILATLAAGGPPPVMAGRQAGDEQGGHPGLGGAANGTEQAAAGVVAGAVAPEDALPGLPGTVLP